MLRTHASFDLPGVALEEEPPFGTEVAELLADGLRRRGLDCSGPEDVEYAHELSVETPQGRCTVMIGHVGDAEGRQWLVFVEPLRRGLLRRSAADPSSVVTALHEVLTVDLGTVPQWFTEKEWNDPSNGRGAPTPTS